MTSPLAGLQIRNETLNGYRLRAEWKFFVGFHDWSDFVWIHRPGVSHIPVLFLSVYLLPVVVTPWLSPETPIHPSLSSGQWNPQMDVFPGFHFSCTLITWLFYSFRERWVTIREKRKRKRCDRPPRFLSGLAEPPPTRGPFDTIFLLPLYLKAIRVPLPIF